MSDKRLVKVVWNDAHATTTIAYAEHEIPHNAMVVTTVGYLLRQDETGVSVANEFCADSTYRGYTFMPAGLIVSVEDVVRPKKKRAKKPKPPDPLKLDSV